MALLAARMLRVDGMALEEYLADVVFRDARVVTITPPRPSRSRSAPAPSRSSRGPCPSRPPLWRLSEDPAPWLPPPLLVPSLLGFRPLPRLVADSVRSRRRDGGHRAVATAT